MSLLTKQDILTADDAEFREIDVPEWGGTLRIKTLTAREAIEFSKTLDGPSQRSSNLRILALCAVDEKGNKLFTKEDLNQLEEKNSRVFTRVAREVIELNGFNTPDKEAEIKNG